jgi:hypothetical protein
MFVMEKIFNQLIDSFLVFLPELIAALLIIFLGLVVSFLLKKIAIKLFDSFNLDDWFEEQNLNTIFGSKSISDIVGFIVMWGVFFVFLQESLLILKLSILTNFIDVWLNFAIKIIVGGIILFMAMIFGRYLRNVVDSMDYLFNHLFAVIIEIVIIYIALVMAINIVGLPTFLLEMSFLILITGVVIALSFAIGISFGLALKDDAKIILSEVRGAKKSSKRKKIYVED